MYPGASKNDPFAAYAVPSQAKDDPFAAYAVPAPPQAQRRPVSAEDFIDKPQRSWTDAAVDLLPAAGGAIGGIAGGIGGTVAGVGVGGVPGAIGGASVGGAFGESVKQLVNRARGAAAPDSSLAAATDIGKEGAIQGAMEAAGGLVAKGMEKLGTAVYRGYLKPSLSKVDLAKAREIVETGIREWLPVTKYGEGKAARLIAELNGQVRSALRPSTAQVDLHTIAERVRAFAQKTYYRPGAPMEDFYAAMKVADEIDKHPSLGLPAGAAPTRIDIPVAQANEVKTGLDRAIGETGFGVERNAATEARKVGRHGAREAIEAQVPAVGKLNARESKVIDAMEAIQRAAAREENKNPLTGWGTTIVAGGVGGGAYAKTDDPYTALAAALAAKGLITPAVATRAAYWAANAGRSPLGRIAVSDAMRLGVVMALRESEQQGQQGVGGK